MASFIDLFSPTFLIFLGILVLTVCLMVVYFESKMRDQNHKIASMVGLVSALADELNNVKYGLSNLSMRGGFSAEPSTQSGYLAKTSDDNLITKLIAVSDDEESIPNENSILNLETSDDESGNDNESDSGNSGDDNDSADEESVDHFNGIETQHFKKIILNVHDNLNENSFNLNDIEEFNDNLSLSSEKSKNSFNQTTKPLYATSQNGVETVESIETDTSINETNVNLQADLKTININLEEQLDPQDYKKLPLNKLKNIVTEKGIIPDASKLKKNEILKLLGVE